MLKNLFVKNFIIIDEISLDFEEGFSAFTGETGAGKSLLIDAIGFLIGDRMMQSMIKKGADSCIIEGVFNIHKDDACKALLEEAMIDFEDEIIVTRMMNTDGKSSIKLNHRTITLNFLKSCLAKQVDIHNQHDTHYLLNKSKHLSLLDAYMNQEALTQEVSKSYQEYANYQKEFDRLTNQSDDRNDIDFIQHQIDEIEQVNPILNEDDELEKLDQFYSKSAKYASAIQEVISLYDEVDGINDRLYQMVKATDLDHEDFVNFSARLNSSYQELEDTIETIKNYQNQMDVSEDEINRVQNRIFEINRLKKKYGFSIQRILDKKEALIQDKTFILNKEVYLTNLQKEIDKSYQSYLLCAEKLHQCRVDSALSLQVKIEDVLHQLMLENARFEIVVEKTKDSKHGFDNVLFMATMNKSTDLKEISKAASGGELSRMMLGLKTIFSNLQQIETLIFDEIDTGVSGMVAGCIGKKMSEIAKDIQVLSVTHLPQVAACSQYHYHVYKTQDEATHSQVEELNNQRRIEELAMLASSSTSEHALSAASELFLRMQKECYE
ncbi:MAG: DNA repair protein RecN [Erysipelotrichaceae bacterium]